MNFSHGALFHMKISVSLKYFVNDRRFTLSESSIRSKNCYANLDNEVRQKLCETAKKIMKKKLLKSE